MLKLEIRNFSNIHENIKMNIKCAFESDIEKAQRSLIGILTVVLNLGACQKILK